MTVSGLFRSWRKPEREQKNRMRRAFSGLQNGLHKPNTAGLLAKKQNTLATKYGLVRNFRAFSRTISWWKFTGQGCGFFRRTRRFVFVAFFSDVFLLGFLGQHRNCLSLAV